VKAAQRSADRQAIGARIFAVIEPPPLEG